MNQAMIDEIVTNVLAKLQPGALRTVNSLPAAKPVSLPQPVSKPVTAPIPTDSKPNVIELTSPVITAGLLEAAVKQGQTVRVGRTSILTPSAKDWLNSHKTSWSRQDRSSGSGSGAGNGRVRWQIILQTVTANVRTLQDGLRKTSDGWKVELVGQPNEAASLAINLIGTADCDGVVIFTEQAEAIACRANRNERVRAAVIENSKHWEHVMRTLSANVVCINPIGRTFIELRNLVRDCGVSKPKPPSGW